MYFLNPISDIKIACTYSLRFASVRLVVRFNPRMANGQGCQDRTFPRVILPGNCPAAARQLPGSCPAAAQHIGSVKILMDPLISNCSLEINKIC